jgi:hypothetical protein
MTFPPGWDEKAFVFFSVTHVVVSWDGSRRGYCQGPSSLAFLGARRSLLVTSSDEARMRLAGCISREEGRLTRGATIGYSPEAIIL